MSGLAESAKQRLRDVCLVSSDTVQDMVDPSLLNKHMFLGTRRFMLLPLNSGISLSLAGQDFGVCGQWGGGGPLPLLVKQDH